MAPTRSSFPSTSCKNHMHTCIIGQGDIKVGSAEGYRPLPEFGGSMPGDLHSPIILFFLSLPQAERKTDGNVCSAYDRMLFLTQLLDLKSLRNISNISNVSCTTCSSGAIGTYSSTECSLTTPVDIVMALTL